MTLPAKYIRALLFMPGQQPRYVDFNDSLDNLQKVVDGHVQAHPVPGEPRATAYMNEEGKLRGMEANTLATRRMYDVLMAGDYIAGPMLVLGITEAGEHCDIPPELAKYMMDRCADEAIPEAGTPIPNSNRVADGAGCSEREHDHINDNPYERF